MERFFFHLRTHDRVSPDPVGILLPDRGTAVLEALKAARLLMGSPSPFPTSWRGWSIQVADGKGAVVFVLPFETARRITDARSEPELPLQD